MDFLSIILLFVTFLFSFGLVVLTTGNIWFMVALAIAWVLIFAIGLRAKTLSADPVPNEYLIKEIYLQAFIIGTILCLIILLRLTNFMSKELNNILLFLNFISSGFVVIDLKYYYRQKKRITE